MNEGRSSGVGAQHRVISFRRIRGHVPGEEGGRVRSLCERKKGQEEWE